MEGYRGHNDIFYVLLAIYQVFYAIHIYPLFISMNSIINIHHWKFFTDCLFFYWQLYQVCYAIHIYSVFTNMNSVINIHH